mgnify:CR=1 FL=1
MSKSRLLAICLVCFVTLFYSQTALAVQVGVAEPFADGPDDQYGTLLGVAQVGVNRMSELGVSWHREWVSWKKWQPTRPVPGQPALQPGAVQLLDQVESLSRSKNLKTYVMIMGAPYWANGSNDQFYMPGNGSPTNPEFQQYVKDYGNFVYQIVSTYKGRIDHWEIGSEYDLAAYWHTAQPASVQQRAAG